MAKKNKSTYQLDLFCDSDSLYKITKPIRLIEFFAGVGGETRCFGIHISKLEVFEKPMELKELYKVGAYKVFEEQFDSSYLKREQQEIMEELEQTITKAPQSWQFIEGE